MPELPEVVVTLRGVSPHVVGKTVSAVTVREPRLRWPVPADLPQQLAGKPLIASQQRAKYMLFEFAHGHLMIHLGMSGNLRVHGINNSPVTPPEKHDHVDLAFTDGTVLRFTDPRRFGSILWLEGDPMDHPLLSHLGPEPFEAECDGDYFFQLSRQKKVAIKQFIMNNHVVVGVGNIYANEALFLAGIRPTVAAGKVSKQRYRQLAEHIKTVLSRAIEQGGTTLKDFVGNDGKPGYFKQQLYVYGRKGEPCLQCDTVLKEIRLGQRSTVYCPRCQK